MEKEIDHSLRGHSEVGASSASRWMSCPASVKASRGLPNTSSPAAKEGTCAHEAADYCLTHDLPGVCAIGQEHEGFKVTPEMAEHVQTYIDVVKSYHLPGTDLLIEETFDLNHIAQGCYGSNDACIVEPFGKLVVIDLKYGMAPVSPVENKQLMYYAIGAMADMEFSEVELVIVQPRVDEPVKTWTTTVERIEEYKKELKTAVDRCYVDKPEYNPSDSACHFCLAKGNCPALKDLSLTSAMVAFDDADKAVMPKPNELSAEQIKQILDNTKLIKSFLDAVGKHAYGQAEGGKIPEGYKLVKTKSNRAWIDEAKVIETFSDMFEKEDLYTPGKLKTPAQLEKIVGKEDVAMLTEKPDKGTSLVHESDKRKAVAPAIDLLK